MHDQDMEEEVLVSTAHSSSQEGEQQSIDSSDGPEQQVFPMKMTGDALED